MTNKPRGVLWIGVAADLAFRIDRHRRDVGSGFCRKHGLKTRVHVERRDPFAPIA